MKQLKPNPTYRTYFVNGGIIYDIKDGTVITTDTHAIVYNEDCTFTFPYIYYENLEGKEYTYYLDSLIEDGDKLNDSGSFSKVCHEINGEPEKTPFEYFTYLCEQQIGSVIADNLDKEYSYYYDIEKNINRLSFFGVPAYMFKQNYDDLINGSSFRESNGAQTNWVTRDKVIDFTEEKYNQLLQDEILRRTKKAANAVANNYNKKVSSLTLTDI